MDKVSNSASSYILYHCAITNVDYSKSFPCNRGFDRSLREQWVGAVGASDTVSTSTASVYGLCKRLDFRRKIVFTLLFKLTHHFPVACDIHGHNVVAIGFICHN